LLFLLFSCTSIDLYEKHVTIPGHSWKSSYKPVFNFTIRDTLSGYQIFVIIRHDEKYNFNNLYVNIYNKQPGADGTDSARVDLPLASNEKGWLASGMDDIYEHRIPLNRREEPVYFRKQGNYEFSIEQIMREDPLQHVYNVGLRIEKIN
jgi:gliding motility-associated lipoprotein GldH